MTTSGSASATSGTTRTKHDPFCPSSTMCECRHPECCVCDNAVWCQCELIAKVRGNEKAKWTHTCPDNNCCNGGPN